MRRLAVVGILTIISISGLRCDVAPKLEVSRFECQFARVAFEGYEVEAFGRVKNISKEPLELQASIAIFVGGDRPNRYDAAVEPAPLPPGEEGRFHLRTPIPFNLQIEGSGECQLEAFRKPTGARIDYVFTGKAANDQQ